MARSGMVVVPFACGIIGMLVEAADGSSKALHFNNDLTNTFSQQSPFHHKGEPYTVGTLNGSVTETAGLGVSTHLLAPGLGWVPWWPSEVAPLQQHHDWMVEVFGTESTTGNSTCATLFRYALGGGDLIAELAAAATAVGQRPAVSFRINDMQMCTTPPSASYGALSEFWYDHRHDPGIMRRGTFNDSCCWEHKCKCSCYDGSASMVLNSPAVLANRLAFMREIASKYPVDFEVDLERWAMIFDPTATTSTSRRATMTSMLRQIRAAMAPATRLGLRVPPDLSLLDSIGVDLPALAADSSVRLDYVTLGVSYYAFLPSTSDFAKVRASLPGTPVLFEVSNLITQSQSNRSDSELLTDEMLATVALDAYSLGADGLSSFNFEYYRSINLAPPYKTLGLLTDEEWVSKSTQHWFYTRSSGTALSRQSPFPLQPNGSRNASMAIRIVVPIGTAYRQGLLRVSRGYEAWGLALGLLGVVLNGVPLLPTSNTSRIYASAVPDIGTGGYAGFIVPPTIVRNGSNEMTLVCSVSECDELAVTHVELMLAVE